MTLQEAKKVIGLNIHKLNGSMQQAVALLMDKAIAWLEKQECGEKGPKGPQEIGDWRGDEGVCKKQKEQKPAWQEVKGRRGRIGDTPEHIRKKAENFLSKMEPPYDADDICSAYETGAMENAKPAEWSKNDTAFLNEITDFFENRTVRLQHDVEMYAHWLKSLPERFNLQPKQEWSDEDEKVIEAACALLCEYAGYYKEKDMEAKNLQLFKVSQRLKSLRPQPKEQDVEKIQALKTVLEKRLDLLHKAIETSKKNKTHLTTKWLDGKECGYSDVLELLNSRPESIRIEL